MLLRPGWEGESGPVRSVASAAPGKGLVAEPEGLVVRKKQRLADLVDGVDHLLAEVLLQSDQGIERGLPLVE